MLLAATANGALDFPSFSEGLSLRLTAESREYAITCDFPSFSEGLSLRLANDSGMDIPDCHFPSFSEGLSLRLGFCNSKTAGARISLPFRKGFH